MSTTPKSRRSIRVRLADFPGSLHELTSLVAVNSVNIVRLEVVSREQPEVWDDIELVAESDQQLDAVVADLKDRGLTVVALPVAWAIRDWATDVLHALETIGLSSDEGEAVELFAETAKNLANVEYAFVLMEPNRPDAAAAESRWVLIQRAARAFDPDKVTWAGSSVGTRIVVSAMRAARGEDDVSEHEIDAVGAVLSIPSHTRRPAHLAVVGRRPAFLAPELGRLGMFAQVAAPHLWVARLEETA